MIYGFPKLFFFSLIYFFSKNFKNTIIIKFLKLLKNKKLFWLEGFLNQMKILKKYFKYFVSCMMNLSSDFKFTFLFTNFIHYLGWQNRIRFHNWNTSLIMFDFYFLINYFIVLKVEYLIETNPNEMLFFCLTRGNQNEILVIEEEESFN